MNNIISDNCILVTQYWNRDGEVVSNMVDLAEYVKLQDRIKELEDELAKLANTK